MEEHCALTLLCCLHHQTSYISPLVANYSLSLPPPTVVLFSVEDNGTAVVLSAVAGSCVQGTAVSETLYVPEPFSIARHPLL